MLESNFHLGDRLVRTVRGHGVLDEVATILLDMEADRYFVVTDDTVREIVGTVIAQKLNRTVPTLLVSQPPGEEHKTLSTLSRYVDAALSFGVTRQSVVVAVGGGVPGNVAGLLAGLLFRGVRLAHFPTTVIAACDSVLSAKQAVNTAHAKNMIGLYHPPEVIVIDLAVLAGNSRRDLRSGTCETVKNALCSLPSRFRSCGDCCGRRRTTTRTSSITSSTSVSLSRDSCWPRTRTSATWECCWSTATPSDTRWSSPGPPRHGRTARCGTARRWHSGCSLPRGWLGA